MNVQPSPQDCEIHPSLSPFLYTTVAIVPFAIFIIGASLSPQDGSFPRIATLLGTAFLVPLVLIGLVLSHQSQLKKGSFARIQDKQLTLKHKDQEQNWELKEVDSIRLNSKFGFATDWKVTTKNKETISFNMGGMIKSEDEQLLKKTLEKWNVALLYS